MSYCTRLLTPNESHVPASALEGRLRADRLPASIRVDEPATMGQEQVTLLDRLRANIRREKAATEAWEQITILDKHRRELAIVERHRVAPQSLAEEELQELLDELDEAYPRSAAAWLAGYLPTVKVIYAFEISGALHTDNWEPIQAIQGELWGTLGGILQADGEGFSNPDGSHILWQFPNDVSGPRNMAVLNQAGQWEVFEMELGNPKHRQAFRDGRVAR